MITQVCMIIITVTVVVLAVFIVKLSLQAKRSIELLETDLHSFSIDASRLANTLDEFIRTDLHPVSEETSCLINKLGNLSSGFNQSGFLSNALRFLTSRSGSSSNETPSIPQLIKWVTSGIFLFKKTREFIKKHEKRKS